MVSMSSVKSEAELEIRIIWARLEPAIPRRKLKDWIAKQILPKHTREGGSQRKREFWYPAILIPQAHRAQELFATKKNAREVRLRLWIEHFEIDADQVRRDLLECLDILDRACSEDRPDGKSKTDIAMESTFKRAKSRTSRTIRKRVHNLDHIEVLSRFAMHVVADGADMAFAKVLPTEADPTVLMQKALNLDQKWPMILEQYRGQYTSLISNIGNEIPFQVSIIDQLYDAVLSALDSELLQARQDILVIKKLAILEAIFMANGLPAIFGINNFISSQYNDEDTIVLVVILLWLRRIGLGSNIDQVAKQVNSSLIQLEQ